LVLGIVGPLNQVARVDAEGIGQLANRGHVRLGFVAFGPGYGGLGKSSALGQLRLG
jgi:hypothetical protein